MPLSAFAEDSSQSFRLSLRADGQQKVSVTEGQEFTVTLTLDRTDAAENWQMFAWQTEILFDAAAFELVDGSVHPAKGVGSSWHPGQNESRLYFNAYSISKKGSTYPASLEAGTFTLRAIKTGSFVIRNDQYLVSTAGGTDQYSCESSDLQVTVQDESSDPDDPPDITDPIPFEDVPMNAWYVDAVKYSVQHKLFLGTSETTFEPYGTMTRAMLVTVLHRMEGTPAPETESGFEDVPSGKWYTEAVAWARETGVVEGYSDTVFGPDDPVTREQMAAILYRYTEKKGCDVSKTANLSRYEDRNEVSNWAYHAVSWANAEGFVLGRSETTLNPKDTATRAEVAMILMRYCKWMEEGAKS